MSLEISAETTFLLDMTNAILYGAELYTTANAISDPAGAEADAITGWLESGLNGTGANVFESQAGVKTTGSYAFHLNTNDTPTPSARIYFDLQAGPTSFVNGQQGKIEIDLRHVGSGGTWDIALGAGTSGTENMITTLDNTETAFVTFVYTWTHSANHRYFVIREAAGNDGGVYADNLSIKKRI